MAEATARQRLGARFAVFGVDLRVRLRPVAFVTRLRRQHDRSSEEDAYIEYFDLPELRLALLGR